MRQAFLDSIRIADLPPDLQTVAAIIGIEAIRLLLPQLGGMEIYLPRPQRLTVPIRRYIQANYAVTPEGVDNALDLARDTGLSVLVVRCHAGVPRRSSGKGASARQTARRRASQRSPE